MKGKFLDVTEFIYVQRLIHESSSLKDLLSEVWETYGYHVSCCGYSGLLLRIKSSEFLIYSKDYIIEQKVLEL